MRKTVGIVGLCVALLLLGPAGALADTILNFDNVADGTNIDTQYAGVTFSCFSSVGACDSTSVFARSFLFAPSLNNIISTVQTGFPGTQDAATGAIKVAFAAPQSAVSIDDYLLQASEGLGSSGYGYLEAFDSDLNFLGIVQDTYGGNPANLGVTKTLSFSSTTGNISYLLLGDVQGANIISAFDNLCYSGDATGCSGGGSNNGVPEPGTGFLLALGLAALAGLKFGNKPVVRMP